MYLNLDHVFTGAGGTVGPLAEVADTLGRLGLSPDRHVVVYDANGGTEAAHVLWLLEYLGFERVSALEGGAERWMAEERPQTAAVPPVAPAGFRGAARGERLATADWVAARLDDRNVRVLDAMTRQLMQEWVLRLFEETRRSSLFVTSELEETIFLADRLIILTGRPTRVKKVMEIDLPRPRSYDALASPRYLELKGEALDALHEEAQRAFAAGSAGAFDLVEAYRKRASAA